MVVDAGVLRKALRLIHCLQKERGATCAHQILARNKMIHKSTSNNPTVTPNQHTSKPLLPARRDTDRAFALLLHNHRFQTPTDTDLPMEKITLDKIRKLVLEISDDDNKKDDPQHVTSNHQLLKSYSTLIQSLSHEYILRHTAVAKHRCDQLQRRQQERLLNSNAINTEGNNNNKNGLEPGDLILRHSHSFHALNEAMLLATPKQHRAHRRNISSDGYLMGTMMGSTSIMNPYSQQQQNRPTSSSSAAASSFSNFLSAQQQQQLPPRIDSEKSFHHSYPDDFDHGVEIERGSSSGDDDDEDVGFHWDFFETDDNVHDNAQGKAQHEHHTDEERVWRLLHLLDVFGRLKESAGVERATLASIVMDVQQSAAAATNNHNNHNHSHNLLLNDLVTEVENQRRQIASLHRLLPRTGALHDLASELVRMSPQMKQLQDTILQGFEVESLSTAQHGGLWNLLTLYIDKLHSLELLIVQEVECCIGLRSVVGDEPLVIDYSNSSLVGKNPSTHSPSSIHTTHKKSSGNNQVVDSTIVFRGDCFGLSATECSSDELRERIESMTPEEIKRRLLSAIAAHTKHDDNDDGGGGCERNIREEKFASVEDTNKGVEDLLAELSKAPAMKEWEIDLYEIKFKKRIGQGNAGTTYLAAWNGLSVAVKVASITEMGLDGWRTEVQNLQRLHHPNVIRLLGSIYHPSPLTFCLVLEYCDGGELTDAMQRPTPPNFFFRIADSVAKGMAYLHARMVIHRDIKPSNVLLEGNVKSGQFQVKITDFGLATAASLSGDRTAETGTYRWMVSLVENFDLIGLTFLVLIY